MDDDLGALRLEDDADRRLGPPNELAVLAALSNTDTIDVGGAEPIFDLLDADGDGRLTFDELKRGVRSDQVVAFVKETGNAARRRRSKSRGRRGRAPGIVPPESPPPPPAALVPPSTRRHRASPTAGHEGPPQRQARRDARVTGLRSRRGGLCCNQTSRCLQGAVSLCAAWSGGAPEAVEALAKFGDIPTQWLVTAQVAGHVSREGWTKFVESMARERVRHLRALGLAARRCYWGKGLDDRAAPSSRVAWLCCGLFPRGAVRPRPTSNRGAAGRSRTA